MPPPGRTLLVVAQPLEAGVPHHVHDVVAAAVREGWRVEVACPQASVLWGIAGTLGAERHVISAARAPSPSDVASLRRLLPLVRRADVTHAHSSKAGVLARFAARLAGTTNRCVFTPHGWSFWAYPAFRPVERVAAAWCRTIVAVSEYERAAGLDALVGTREQYEVIPNGVDLDRFSPTPVPVPPTDSLVMVARLAPPRRHEIVLRALAILRASRPTATLAFVGEGHRRAELEQLAADLGLTDAVTFAGHQTDVPAWIRRSALVVHASDYEGAATAVLEAMACGRGVVASALGGMDELVVRGVTGELCGDDPHEWASSIARALDARDRLGTAGRARAEDRFSAARMTASTLALYERILTEREYSV